MPAETVALRLPEPTAGFTILEVLVALTVLGLVVAVLFQGLTAGLRRTAYDEARLTMILEASQILERIDIDLGGGVPSQSGSDGPLRWRLERTPVRAENAKPVEPGELLLVRYVVTVTDPDGRDLSVETKRIATAPGASTAPGIGTGPGIGTAPGLGTARGAADATR